MGSKLLAWCMYVSNDISKDSEMKKVFIQSPVFSEMYCVDNEEEHIRVA